MFLNQVAIGSFNVEDDDILYYTTYINFAACNSPHSVPLEKQEVALFKKKI
jgi:hypothetical protein